jgi:BolA protein
MTETVRQTLLEALQAQHVAIIDNSWQHQGHAAMAGKTMEGTHLHITIVSPQFEGVSLLNRHRLVHGALTDAFATHLHALELKTYSPEEWALHSVTK